MNILYLIPARGGSKGIPHKNIKPLNGKKLIEYSIDIARQLTEDENICVSTDDDAIIDIVQAYGLDVPFKRPQALATDTIGTYEVLLHAINYYKSIHKNYDTLVLLQPTSPFRRKVDVENALKIYSPDIDMVVSVKESTANPYFNCFEENKDGFLKLSKGEGGVYRRQDIPKVWEYNGAIYIINIESLIKNSNFAFDKIKKYVMEPKYSLDIDTFFDWQIAELIIKNKIIEL